MMPTFPEYRNSRRQTDRKETRKEKDDPTRRKAQPGPISVTLDSWTRPEVAMLAEIFHRFINTLAYNLDTLFSDKSRSHTIER